MAEEAEIREDIIDRALKIKKGPPAFIVLKWNGSTRQFFDKGNKPRQGRKYVLKCTRNDGKHSYFDIVSM